MPRIVFIADPKLPRDIAHLGYRKDQEVELPGNQCERWIRRGVAKYVQAEPAAALQPTSESSPAPVPESKPVSTPTRLYGRGRGRTYSEAASEPPKEGETVASAELPKEPDLV